MWNNPDASCCCKWLCAIEVFLSCVLYWDRNIFIMPFPARASNTYPEGKMCCKINNPGHYPIPSQAIVSQIIPEQSADCQGVIYTLSWWCSWWWWWWWWWWCWFWWKRMETVHVQTPSYIESERTDFHTTSIIIWFNYIFDYPSIQ